MKLDALQVNHFRNIENLSISPSPSLNLVYGENGSGKSSLLEAIHFLGFGRSFRSSKAKHIIKQGESAFTLHAKCSYEQNNGSRALGLQRSLDDSVICSIDGERSRKVSELVALVPVQVFTPQSIELVIGAPSLRRSFLDWGLFHVEQSYRNLNRNYQKVLRHRNALLKKIQKSGATFGSNNTASQNEEIHYWTTQLGLLGKEIDIKRKGYWTRFLPEFERLIGQFLPEFSLELSYYSGWDSTSELSQQLERKASSDIRFGFTSLGPHKADFRIKSDGKPASEILSRGQLRMLVAALQLAQAKHLYAELSEGGIFLLDDIGAELDETRRGLFVEELVSTNTQVFITAIEVSQFSLPASINNKKVFHVKHGHVIEE